MSTETGAIDLAQILKGPLPFDPGAAPRVATAETASAAAPTLSTGTTSIDVSKLLKPAVPFGEVGPAVATEEPASLEGMPLLKETTEINIAALFKQAVPFQPNAAGTDEPAPGARESPASRLEGPGADNWECVADPFHLKRVFRNLLENALGAGGDPPLSDLMPAGTNDLSLPGILKARSMAAWAIQASPSAFAEVYRRSLKDATPDRVLREAFGCPPEGIERRWRLWALRP